MPVDERRNGGRGEGGGEKGSENRDVLKGRTEERFALQAPSFGGQWCCKSKCFVSLLEQTRNK